MAELKAGTTVGGYVVWHQGNDGTSSGLDADLWDGNQFEDYINQAVKTTSTVTFNSVKHTTSSMSEAAVDNIGFSGTGNWRIDVGLTTLNRSTMVIDDITVRGTLSVFELMLQQVRATNGTLVISSAAKVVHVDETSGTAYIDSEVYVPFAVNDIILAKRWTGTGVYESVLQVTGVTQTPQTITGHDRIYRSFTYAVLDSSTPPIAGHEYVRVGNTSNTDRQGSVTLNAENAPYIELIRNRFSGGTGTHPLEPV